MCARVVASLSQKYRASRVIALRSKKTRTPTKDPAGGIRSREPVKLRPKSLECRNGDDLSAFDLYSPMLEMES